MGVKTMLNIPVIEIPCNPKNCGGYRPLSAIKFVVIHYTANKWDSARSNLNYFANNVVKASANYFVDSKQIGVSVPDEVYAWHCGGGLQGDKGHKWFGKCNNYNSIGIEICDDVNDGKVMPSDQALKNAQMLTAYLMKKYSVPIENVIRHWDVTGKICPAYFVGEANTETGKAWLAWKEGVEELMAVRFKTVNDVPASLRKETQQLIDAGALKGKGGDKGLDVTEDMLRCMIITKRYIDSKK